MNLKQQLLAIEKKVVKVKIPEMTAPVFVKVMTGAEYEAYVGLIEAAGKTSSGNRAALVALTACDETGKKIFECVEETHGVNTTVLERLATVALKLNGMTPAAREEYEKNS